MATPTWCCGAECGTQAANAGNHWFNAFTNAAFSTTTVRSGSRSIRVNPTAATGQAFSEGMTGSNLVVARAYIYVASAPTADAGVFTVSASGAFVGLVYQSSDAKYYAGRDVGGAISDIGATGLAIPLNTWTRIDLRVNTSANPWVIDAQVEGVALGQSQPAIALSNASGNVLCGSTGTKTFDIYYDDIVAGNTSGDYPFGAGYIHLFVPTADGTHNIAGTGDFQRGNTGTDILNSTTTAWQLIDDVPIPSGGAAPDQADCIRAVAPANPTTDYVECVFGPFTGVPIPTTGPRAVEVYGTYHQIATQSGEMEVLLNDNATTDFVLDTGVVAGVTTLRYFRKHYADPPSAASVWTAGGAGNGDFNDLRVRFRAPDAAPDQCLDSILIEAEFSGEIGGAEFVIGGGVLTQAAMPAGGCLGMGVF
jgi:hypothetical protein